MSRERRDALASTLGVLVFLAGIGIVGWTLLQAFEIFSQTPRMNLGVVPGKPIDISIVGLNLARLLVKILVLVFIAGVGSAIANRGARMYASGKNVVETVEPKQSNEPG